jgi:hypothetical protein
LQKKIEKKLRKTHRFISGDSYEINDVDPFSELRVLTGNALQAHQYVKSLDSSFPDTEII